MRKDTKLFKVLKFIYLNREKGVTNKEISESTGIPVNKVPRNISHLKWHVRKFKKDGLNHFTIRKFDMQNTFELIKNAT